MTKKLIAFFTMIVFVITCFAIGVQADEEVLDGGEMTFEEKIVRLVLPDLNFQMEDDIVTREEFLTTVIASLVPSLSASASRSDFSDVDASESFAGVLQYALEVGAVSPGVKFYPREAITYGQAIKIVTVLLGYAEIAEHRGGYPAGYAAVAKSIGLLDNLKDFDVEPSLTKADAYKLLYHYLTVDMLQTKSYGDKERREATEGENILSLYYDIYEVRGLVEANENTSLYDMSGAVEDGKIRIGDILYEADTGADYLGYYVRAFYQYDSRTNDRAILYIERYNNRVVEIKAREFIRLDGTRLIYDQNDRQRTLGLSEDFKTVYNGKALSAGDIEEYLKFNAGDIKLIDSNRDGAYDVLLISKFDYLYIGSIDPNEKRIYDKYVPSNVIDLSDPACNYIIYDRYYYGEEIVEVEALSANTLIAYSASLDSELYTIRGLNQVIEGTISALFSESETIRINENDYYLSEYALKNFKEMTAGTSGTFFIGLDNDVVVYQSSGEIWNYGWVVDVANAGGAFHDTYKIKIFSDNGSMSIFDLAEKAAIDDKPMQTSASEEVQKTLASLISGPDDSRLIRYKLDKDGKIKYMDLPSQAFTVADLKRGENLQNVLNKCYSGSYKYKISPLTFGELFCIDASTKIFAIPPADSRDDEKDFLMLQTGYFIDDQSYTLTAYDYDVKTGLAGALLMITSASRKPASTENSGVTVIEDVMRAVVDGEPCYILSGWNYTDGFVELIAPEETEVCIGDSEEYGSIEAVGSGDIVRCEYNLNKRISAIALDYDISVPIDERCNLTGQHGYTEGYLYSYTGNSAVILSRNTDFTNVENLAISEVRPKRILKTLLVEIGLRDDGTAKSAFLRNIPADNVRTYTSGYTSADYVVIKNRFTIGTLCVIYRMNS